MLGSKSLRLRAQVAQVIAVSAIAAASQALLPARADIVLEEIVVKGQHLREDATAFTSNTIGAEEIRAASLQQSQEILRRVPGLEIKNFGLGGVADSISLRGFGGGSHGGDLGFLIDGVPLNEAISHADGYADLNVLIPLELGQVTTFKGPSTALYGNYNRGGTIFVETRKGGDYRYADTSGGSDSTFDLQSAIGMETGSGPLNVAAQVYRTDGFRPQSEYEKGTFSGRYALAVGDKTKLAFSGRGHRGDWDSASYITEAQFNGSNPHGIDPRVQNDGGDKDFYTLRTDLVQKINGDLKLLGFAYGTQQKFTRYFTRPINPTTWRQREEAYDRDVQGAGFNLNGVAFGSAISYVAGIEAYRESTGYDFYDNLNFRQRTAPAIYDRTFEFISTSAFVEGQWEINQFVRPIIGVRYDRFEGECESDGPETGADPCNRKMNDYNRTSPKVGLRSTLFDGFDLRASYSSGFQLPNPRGLFSPGAADVDANVFNQIEVGANWSITDVIAIDLSVFQLDSEDEIRELPAGSGQFVNFGDTRREGAELSLSWTPIRNWSATLAAGVVDTEILVNPDPTLVGKKLAGVPDTTASLGLSYQPPRGFGGRVFARNVGDTEVNATNTIQYGGYSVVDLGATYRGTVFDSNLRAYLSLNNALDRDYASSVFVIGGATLFAPAPPRQIILGAQVDF